MKKYCTIKTTDGKIITAKDIRMENPRIVYWIMFPQGVQEKNKFGTMYSSMMIAKTFKKAWKLFKKYNGSELQRLIECDLGRWTLRSICKQEDVKLTDTELYEKYKGLPEIIL